MKHPIRNASFALLVPLAALACSSTEKDEGAATGASITKAADQIEVGIQQLDATVAALTDLTEKPAPDLNTQRKTFEQALASLESTAEDVSETSADMDGKGQAFFTRWDEQLASIQNEDIRERSAERRKAIEASLTKLKGDYGDARDAFVPLLNDLRDIRTALKADLTMSGIDALKPSVKKANKNAGSVSKELKDLVERFRELGVGLARVGPALEAVEKEKEKKK